VLGTTLAAPPLLRTRLGALQRRRPARPPAIAPSGGWLRVDAGTVDLVEEPPDVDALVVALEAARLVATADPSPRLRDWLGAVDLGATRWDRRATSRFLVLLREGSLRSWRFLE